MTRGQAFGQPVILVRSWPSSLEVYSLFDGRTRIVSPSDFTPTSSTPPSVQPTLVKLADRSGPWLEALRTTRETLLVRTGPRTSKAPAKPRTSKAKPKPDPMAILMAKFKIGAK